MSYLIEELIAMRVSIARIAQAAGIPLTDVGVDDPNAPYEVLRTAAANHPRGWGMLASRICGIWGVRAT